MDSKEPMKNETNGKLSIEMAPEKTGKEMKKKCFVNKTMLPYKLHFFLFIGGMGAILPYQSIFGITRLGFTASNIAAAYTAQQILFIVLKPGIGYLADYFNRLKATIVGLTILHAIFSFLLIMIPRVEVQSLSNDHISYLNVSQENLNHCHLCNNFQEFRAMTLTLPFDEDFLEHGINCIESSPGNITPFGISCPNQNTSSFDSNDRNIKIMYRTCNDSQKSGTVSLSSTTSNISYTNNNIFFITLMFNETEITHIICVKLKKAEINFVDMNITFSLLKDYCYFIPKQYSGNLDGQSATEYYPINNTISCDNAKQYSENEDNIRSSAAIFKTYQFWFFTVCMISACTCASCVFTMSDTACYESVQNSGSDYGRTRIFGAISWGFMAPLAGWLNDYTDSFVASWLIMAVFCSLQIWNMSKMNLRKPDSSQSIMKDVKIVFSSFEFVAFEIGVFMNGFFTGIIWFYLTWFLNSIGGNKLLIGLAHTVECYFGEVPIMFYSTWIIKKLGHFNVVSLALFTHGIRFFIYSYLHNPWWILPIESLHGFTFGSFYSAMTSYGKLSSKPGTEATTQSILCITYEAVGAGLGCVIVGVCFDRFGSHTTFFYASFLCALTTAINLMFTLLIKFRKGTFDVTKSSQKY